MSYKADTLRLNEYAKVRYKCKHCGHSNTIVAQVDHKICGWCKNMIFKNERDEFLYRMREANIHAKREK